MTDTAPKTPDSAEVSELVREMAEAIKQACYSYPFEPITWEHAAKAAARVLLDAQRKQLEGCIENPEFVETGYYWPIHWLDTFRNEHGLSAEDET